MKVEDTFIQGWNIVSSLSDPIGTAGKHFYNGQTKHYYILVYYFYAWLLFCIYPYIKNSSILLRLAAEIKENNDSSCGSKQMTDNQTNDRLSIDRSKWQNASDTTGKSPWPVIYTPLMDVIEPKVWLLFFLPAVKGNILPSKNSSISY